MCNIQVSPAVLAALCPMVADKNNVRTYLTAVHADLDNGRIAVTDGCMLAVYSTKDTPEEYDCTPKGNGSNLIDPARIKWICGQAKKTPYLTITENAIGTESYTKLDWGTFPDIARILNQVKHAPRGCHGTYNPNFMLKMWKACQALQGKKSKQTPDIEYYSNPDSNQLYCVARNHNGDKLEFVIMGYRA